MVLEPKTNFSLAKRWFWRGVLKENHLFAREKLVFLCATIFLRGKTKKTIFFKILSPFSKKMVFFGSLVLPRTSLGPEPFSSALHVDVQWTVLVRSKTCQHTWRLVGFGQSNIDLSNSIPIPINVNGLLTIFIGLLFILLIFL